MNLVNLWRDKNYQIQTKVLQYYTPKTFRILQSLNEGKQILPRRKSCRRRKDPAALPGLHTQSVDPGLLVAKQASWELGLGRKHGRFLHRRAHSRQPTTHQMRDTSTSAFACSLPLSFSSCAGTGKREPAGRGSDARGRKRRGRRPELAPAHAALPLLSPNRPAGAAGRHAAQQRAPMVSVATPKRACHGSWMDARHQIRSLA